MCPQSQAGTSTFWLDVVGSWWLKVLRCRRWRLASGRRKVVKLGRCRPVPRGACGAGGAPAPGNGAMTPLREAGGQKAPSTRRCIKTSGGQSRRSPRPDVRKHPAPEGALRHSTVASAVIRAMVRKHPVLEGALGRLRVQVVELEPRVRKHPAPEGALRPSLMLLFIFLRFCQKAPSTRRCIKTIVGRAPQHH